MKHLNLTPSQIKAEIYTLAAKLNISKNQIKISCKKQHQSIYIAATELINADDFHQLERDLDTHFGVYDRNAGDMGADYPSYTSDLIGYTFFNFKYDYESAPIKEFFNNIKTRINQITNGALIYLCSNKFNLNYSSYRQDAAGVANLALYNQELRNILDYDLTLDNNSLYIG